MVCSTSHASATYQSLSPPPTSPPQQPLLPLPLPLHSSTLSPRAGIAAATAQLSGAACGVMWPTGKSASPVPSSDEALSVGRAPAPGSVGMRGVSERGRPPQSQAHVASTEGTVVAGRGTGVDDRAEAVVGCVCGCGCDVCATDGSDGGGGGAEPTTARTAHRTRSIRPAAPRASS